VNSVMHSYVHPVEFVMHSYVHFGTYSFAVCVHRDICMHISRTLEFVMHSYVHFETYSSTVLVNASQTLEFVTYAYTHVHMSAFQGLHMNAFCMNVSRTLHMSS